MTMADLARWERDERRWHFVLRTFWQYDYEQMVRFLASCGSLDEAVRRAEEQLAGMETT